MVRGRASKAKIYTPACFPNNEMLIIPVYHTPALVTSRYSNFTGHRRSVVSCKRKGMTRCLLNRVLGAFFKQLNTLFIRAAELVFLRASAAPHPGVGTFSATYKYTMRPTQWPTTYTPLTSNNKLFICLVLVLYEKEKNKRNTKRVSTRFLIRDYFFFCLFPQTYIASSFNGHSHATIVGVCTRTTTLM